MFILVAVSRGRMPQKYLYWQTKTTNTSGAYGPYSHLFVGKRRAEITEHMGWWEYTKT